MAQLNAIHFAATVPNSEPWLFYFWSPSKKGQDALVEWIETLKSVHFSRHSWRLKFGVYKMADLVRYLHE